MLGEDKQAEGAEPRLVGGFVRRVEEAERGRFAGVEQGGKFGELHAAEDEINLRWERAEIPFGEAVAMPLRGGFGGWRSRGILAEMFAKRGQVTPFDDRAA